jgi:hypothetical protein
VISTAGSIPAGNSGQRATATCTTLSDYCTNCRAPLLLARLVCRFPVSRCCLFVAKRYLPLYCSSRSFVPLVLHSSPFPCLFPSQCFEINSSRRFSPLKSVNARVASCSSTCLHALLTQAGQTDTLALYSIPVSSVLDQFL